MNAALSLLDLALVGPGATASEALAGCVLLAQRAEARGFARIWYAEHHNMAAIASSAPAVLIAHIAAHTHHILLGAGGVMLPNHAPLSIAEQYGTLATLHPGRIELGLGRAPGTDPATLRALRRDAHAAETFPQDVLELQGYLSERTLISGIEATPGKGTRVPLYVLGSSLFGARLAARLGLPFGFASHFAPSSLREAVALYRTTFQPSEQCSAPRVLAGVNALVAHSDDDAQRELRAVRRARVGWFLARGQTFTDDQADALLASPQGMFITEMMRYTAVGTTSTVRAYLQKFATLADADELIVSPAGLSIESRLRCVDLLADAWNA
jgi:luciferase family oxidoreductase group 1